jgi:sulfate transport system permease protein
LKSPDYRPGIDPPLWINAVIAAAALGFLTLFIVMPLLIVLKEAFSDGLMVWWASIREKDAVSAIRLTLIVAAIAVPLNLVFGLCGVMAAREVPLQRKDAPDSLIDLPFAVSRSFQGWYMCCFSGCTAGWGLCFRDMTSRLFLPCRDCSCNLVCHLSVRGKELIPLMTEQGTEEEQAA